MEEINPKKDIEIIRTNLKKSKEDLANSIEEIGFQEEALNAISPFWEGLGDKKNFDVPTASGAALLHVWAQQSQPIADRSHSIHYDIVTTSGTVINVASTTGTLAQFGSKMEPDSNQIIKLLDRKLEREKIRQGLNKVDTSLGDVFATIWQYQSYPAFDPGRGPLLQMRQLFDHFLEKMSPDEDVAAQPDFVPDPKLKEKNGVGVTRPHRVEYLANVKVKDPNARETVLKSTKSFTDTYQKLNYMHNRSNLDQDKVNSALRQGEALIQEWLRVLELL